LTALLSRPDKIVWPAEFLFGAEHFKGFGIEPCIGSW